MIKLLFPELPIFHYDLHNVRAAAPREEDLLFVGTHGHCSHEADLLPSGGQSPRFLGKVLHLNGENDYQADPGQPNYRNAYYFGPRTFDLTPTHLF